MKLNEKQSIELKKLGMVRVKNLISENEIAKIKQIIFSYKAPKAHKDTYFAYNIQSLFIKLAKGDLKKFKESLYLIKLCKKKNLNSIANKYFVNKSSLISVDGYYAPISNQKVLDWHCDMSNSNREQLVDFDTINPYVRSLKFFIYLTDVSSNNGCMSYIPLSNKIAYTLKKGILENKINYKKFQFLKDFRKIISEKNNYDYLKENLEDENILDKFLEDTKFIEEGTDTTKFDYNMKAGDAIIFDENGIHKGSKTLENERLVLRYFFRPKKSSYNGQQV
jgi:ectoine hydroxylase-related dioxygenase (phytanoyl-CoA dioxygenase family)